MSGACGGFKSSSGLGGVGGGTGSPGGAATATIGCARREYVTVGNVGGITRKSMVATQGGGMGG